MASQAFHLELRVSNIDDPEKLLAIRHALQDAAQNLSAAVVLISGENVEPEITLYGESFANGQEPIALSDEEVL